MTREAGQTPSWTYLYIERTDAGYTARIVESSAGREVRSFPEPTIRENLEHLLAADGQHVIDVIESFDEAERNYARRGNSRARYWQDLGWRAKRGEASEQDVEAAAHALERGELRTIFLLNILVRAGASQYEHLIASLLDSENDDGQAKFAMRALLDFGLIDKYADTLITWMREISPRDRHGLRESAIAIAGGALRLRQNAKVLRALIDSAKDSTVTMGLRGTAVISLATMLGMDTKEWVGREHDPAFVERIVKRAEDVRQHLD